MANTNLSAAFEHVTGQAGPPGTAASRAYFELLGFLPPRVEARLAITGALDARSVELQEAIRDHAMAPACFDAKTTQLLIFAMLVMDLSDAAVIHAVAARRCGATWEELQAIVSLCFLFRGLPAANRGASMLVEAAQRELDATASERPGGR